MSPTMSDKTFKKMATESQCSVVVVDGSYSALNKLGFSISALACMQDPGLLLETGCWDIKKSGSAVFSVSFFWPTAGTTKAHNSSYKNKNKKRRRRSNKKSKAAAGFERDNHTDLPIIAHHTPKDKPKD